MLLITQIVLIIFFLFATTRVWGKYRAQELSLSSAIGWSIFWLLAALVVALPNSSAQVAELVGIGRGADLVVYLSLAFLFFIIFRLTIQIERLNKQLTQVVRKKALEEVGNSPLEGGAGDVGQRFTSP